MSEREALHAEQQRAQAIKAKAARYLRRTGNDDLIEILGLDEQQPGQEQWVWIGGSRRCRRCHGPVRTGGACRRRDCMGLAAVPTKDDR